jgi:hypothetical protein
VTYEQILARQPASHVIGDRIAATEFVDFLGAEILAGISALTDSQRAYLYRLRAKWQLRADGNDPIWNVQGSRAGRPAGSGKKRPPKKSPYGHEEDHDPLLASLMRKYATPLPPEDL